MKLQIKYDLQCYSIYFMFDKKPETAGSWTYLGSDFTCINNVAVPTVTHYTWKDVFSFYIYVVFYARVQLF